MCFNFVVYSFILLVLQLDDVVKEYFEKIMNIVDEILKLIFIEVVDLNELLKVRKIFEGNLCM